MQRLVCKEGVALIALQVYVIGSHLKGNAVLGDFFLDCLVVFCSLLSQFRVSQAKADHRLETKGDP